MVTVGDRLPDFDLPAAVSLSTPDHVNDAVRIAATVSAAAVALEIDDDRQPAGAVAAVGAPA